jgi:hypothetical protein
LYSRLVSWFDALSPGVKLALVLAALVAVPIAVSAAVLLSPLVFLSALALFIVSAAVLLGRARRNEPLKKWGLTLGVSLMLTLAFGSISAAMYGGFSGEKQASAPKPASEVHQKATSQPQESSARQQGGTSSDEPKEAKQPTRQHASKDRSSNVETAHQVSNQQAPGQGVQKTGAANPDADDTGTGGTSARVTEQVVASKPLSYQQRVRQAIAKRKFSGDKIAGVYVQTDQIGCKRIYVRHQAGAGWEAMFISWFMEDAYKAVYKDPALSNGVCSVTVKSTGRLQNKYGKVSNPVIYSTTLNSATASKINWQRAGSVNFANLWTVNYRHPAFAQAMLQEQAEWAADCAKDEGLFDVDIGCE